MQLDGAVPLLAGARHGHAEKAHVETLRLKVGVDPEDLQHAAIERDESAAFSRQVDFNHGHGNLAGPRNPLPGTFWDTACHRSVQSGFVT